eukprot:NODE_464_length_2196_cov_111.089415_g428_i0.p1 GENE.NODE_464_length_2196_cov_111.089415_g428_i0~~NODE_464_length_2196_cov_111.089415_g428_i0.p1  ORF type:complete len:709 (+),score=177.57 NODE_464_length_2196_cov_111.089415_g428_i0:55-2127(+)
MGKTDPEQNRAQTLKSMGNDAFSNGEFAEAARYFTECISLDDSDHVFYSNRSACHAGMKHFAQALEDARECVRIAPKWTKGYRRLAIAQAGLEDYASAKKTYEQALVFEPDNELLAEGLAEVKAALMASKRKQVEQAVAEAQKPAASPEDTVVIRIDLGTTFSCVSVWRNGKVDVLPNEQGARTTPSFVAFTEDGERLVGQPAKSQAPRNATRTLYNIKRLIGQSFADSREEIKRMPFTVSEDPKTSNPVVEIEHSGSTHKFAPEAISAMVLEKMKATAEQNLGHPVKRAVITVPAYFNDAQRRSTKTAGAIAGLEVERIINEPTAAALAYGLDKQGEGTVLVFDLGGGTFDVSLLHIENGMFQVLATAGDTHLGGEDFDMNLQEHLREEFKKKNGSDLFTTQRSIRQLRNACERAKCMLSASVTTTLELEVGGEELCTKVSRATFEMLNAKLFERCLVAVKRVLDDAKVDKAAVDEVVLVGGSTRIPKVQELLQEFFDGKQLCKSVNPDEAVAYGAAVQAAILSGVRDESMQQLILVDVTPLTLGIGTEGRAMAKIVPRNTTIPCTRTKDFTTVEDFQTVVDIPVYEGERACTDGNHLLGEFKISGIERAKQGVAKIDVTFDINANGLLTVTARDRVTGVVADIRIENDRGRPAPEEVERMVREAEEMRAEDERRVQEAEAELHEDDDE